MKNIKKEDLRTCICLACEEYERILRGLFGSAEVHYDLDGLWYSKNNGEDDLDEDDIRDALAEYFDVVAVTSIHADDCDYPGIWITYISEEETGEWVYGENDIPHCSECGFVPKEISPYCPHCGVHMEEGED